MSLRYVIRPAADRDIDEIAEYYAAEGGSALAARFLEGLYKAIAFIRETPGGGAPRYFGNRKLKGLRAWPIPGFEDIRIYYLQPEANLIRILRVLHGKRDVNRVLKSEAG